MSEFPSRVLDAIDLSVDHRPESGLYRIASGSRLRQHMLTTHHHPVAKEGIVDGWKISR